MFEGSGCFINPVLIGVFVSSLFQLLASFTNKEKKADFIFNFKFSSLIFLCIIGFNLWQHRTYVFELVKSSNESLTQEDVDQFQEVVKQRNQELQKKKEEQIAKERQYEFLAKYATGPRLIENDEEDVIREQKRQTKLLEQINNELQFQHVQHDF